MAACPGRALVRVARRGRPPAAGLGVALLFVLLAHLAPGAFERGVPPAMRWLQSAVLGLAVWLFLAHLLWRLGVLLGGRGRFRRVAATTSSAFTAGGLLLALSAELLPGAAWAGLAVGVWAWWLVVEAVRRGVRAGYSAALSAAFTVSAFVWACYIARLPWRWEAAGLDLVPALWGVEAPAEFLRVPGLAVLGALAFLAAGSALAALARGKGALAAGAGLALAGLALLVPAGWFHRYLAGFPTRPLNQPQAVAVDGKGRLLVKGVGGVVCLEPGGRVRWQVLGPADALLPGPGDTALIIYAGRREVRVISAEGRLIRRAELPREVPLGPPLVLGESACDTRGTLYFLTERPLLLHRVRLAGQPPRDEPVPLSPGAVFPGRDRPVSLAVDGAGRVWLADQPIPGRVRLFRFAPGGTLRGVGSLEVEPDARVRLAAGRDGFVYVGLSRPGGEGVAWEVHRLRPDGTTGSLVRVSAAHFAAPATPNVSFAVDARGTIYAADRAGFRLLVFSGEGAFVRMLPSRDWYRRLAARLLRTYQRGAAG